MTIPGRLSPPLAGQRSPGSSSIGRGSEPGFGGMFVGPRYSVHFASDLPAPAAGRAGALGDRQDGVPARGAARDRGDPRRPGLGVHPDMGRPRLLVSLSISRRRLRAHGEGTVELGPDRGLVPAIGREQGRTSTSPTWARERSRPTTGPRSSARTGRSSRSTSPVCPPNSADHRPVAGTSRSPWPT